MTDRHRHRLLGFAALGALWLAGACLVTGEPSTLLHFGPLFGLLLPLLMGCYVGERQIERLRHWVAARSAKPPSRPARSTAAPVTRVIGAPSAPPLALGLAVRPPPAFATR